MGDFEFALFDVEDHGAPLVFGKNQSAVWRGGEMDFGDHKKYGVRNGLGDVFPFAHLDDGDFLHVPLMTIGIDGIV